MERRLVAILAADVVGYSRLMGADEAGTLAALKAHRADVIDPAIAARGGRIVKLMGDGALVEFASVVAAVECAVAIQRGMAERNRGAPSGRRMELRIGINVGDVIVDEEDLYGEGVNLAARLETLADPGGICISRAVYDHVAGKLPQAVEDMGEQSLKNIEEPVNVYRIVTESGTPRAASGAGPAAGSRAPELRSMERPSIAILPFKNLSGDPGQDHLAEGLRLGILSAFVQLPGLFLISAKAANAYREHSVPAAQAGSEVGARYVLEGAVQQAGERVRATLQLTDAEAGEIVWAERYDRVLGDLFAMQDEITEEVIISLDVRLLGREHDRLWFRRITHPEARELWLRGISHLYAGTRDDNAAARRMFERFYHVEPDLSFGSGIVALTHWLDSFNGWADSEARSNQQAFEWAEKAVRYDESNNGFGHVVLGHLQLFEGRHEEALANCLRATEIRASCPLAYGVLASAYNFCGDPLQAIASARKALQIERIYPPWLINVLAAAYRDAGMVGLSIPAAEESIRLDPKQTGARVILCSDYALAESRDQARRVAGEVVTMDPMFRLSSFAERQPYKDTAMLRRLIEGLQDAGLPD